MDTGKSEKIARFFGLIMEECRVSVVSRIKEVMSCRLSGRISLPHRQGTVGVQYDSTVKVRVDENGAVIQADCPEELPLGTWSLAENILLEKGQLCIAQIDGKIHVFLKGIIQFTGPGRIAATGILHAPVIYHGSASENCSVTALLTEASITLDGGLSLAGGTIWLSIHTGPGPEMRFAQGPVDEDAERFFQTEKPLFLDTMSMVGIENQPVTMSVRIDAGPSRETHLLLTLFPARLLAPPLGEKTSLFVHGANYDEPFTIDAVGEWNAAVSSNVFLHLECPSDPQGPDLLHGTAALCGTLRGTGMKANELVLEAELTRGILFPGSDWPQSLPDQKIRMAIGPRKQAAMELMVSQVETGAFCIKPGEGPGSLMRGSLCPRGILLNHATLECDGREPEVSASLIVDGHCRYSLLPAD